MEIAVCEIGAQLCRANGILGNLIDGKFESDRSDVFAGDVQQLFYLQTHKRR